MARRKDTPTRHEVTEKIDVDQKDMQEKEVDLDKIASDVETVRKTLGSLDFRGTAEGSEEIERSIEGAEEVTKTEFGKEDETLDRIQADNQEFEKGLQDRRGASESDMGKVSDASGKIETKETTRELEKAKEAVRRDINFLGGQISRASDARKKSEAIQEKHKARVHTGKRGR